MRLNFSTQFFRKNLDLVLLTILFCAISCTTNSQVKENPVTSTPTNAVQQTSTEEINSNKPINKIEDKNSSRAIKQLKIESVDIENNKGKQKETIEETTGAAGRNAKSIGDKAG